ncbi:extracellular solute-binding protein [Planotetraspora sp. A-T 1434]|uniref:ABC transporter substrate-binding protein n=1 Tax=Planotetraspora sp. A-T 1434 TaxID=2979219 RepID=UPI0021BEE0E7|nr:extracellular solute-binding protein [Planotetraspora sp. A-T 1434]MCT9930129.1 extracellular solute-binding protein [Planotetraspora sp. A-T 1434]
MKKILALGAALTLAAGLSACSVGDNNGGSTTQPSGSGAAAKKEITFLVFETDNLTPKFWDDNIKRVSEKVGVTVKKIVAPGDRTAYAKQLLASGQFPDVQIGLQDLPSFDGSGNLAEFSDEDLQPFLCPKCSAIKGRTVQLPANTQTWQVFYRKSLFEKAGISAPPKTYAELLADAEKLKGKGVQPFVIGGNPSWGSSLPWTGELTTDLYAGNPEWMHQRRDGKVKFDSPEFLKATKKFADLAAKGYLNKKDLGQSYDASQAAFLDGKGAMYPMGSWFAAASDASKVKDDIGIFAWPADDGSFHLPSFTGGGLTVNAKSPNVDIAKKFAVAWQTDKDYLDTSAVADALFPAIKGYTLPAKDGTVFKAVYDLYRQAVDQNATVPSFGWEQGDDGMIAGMPDKWNLSAQDIITGKKTPEEVLKYLDTEWDKSS